MPRGLWALSQRPDPLRERALWVRRCTLPSTPHRAAVARMFCAISGVTPTVPVVSKSGNLYEKSVIEKYIESTGKDPVSGEPLDVGDLLLTERPATRPVMVSVEGQPKFEATLGQHRGQRAIRIQGPVGEAVSPTTEDEQPLADSA